MTSTVLLTPRSVSDVYMRHMTLTIGPSLGLSDTRSHIVSDASVVSGALRSVTHLFRTLSNILVGHCVDVLCMYRFCFATGDLVIRFDMVMVTVR